MNGNTVTISLISLFLSTAKLFKPMGKAYQFYLLLITVVLASCGTSNKFASSFGKRRYTKGFYVDMPSGVKNKVTPVTSLRPMQTKHVNSISNPLSESNISNRITDIPAFTGNQRIAAKASHTGNAPIKAIRDFKTTASAPASDIKKTNGVKGSGETNYFAILGFLICVTGVILCISAQMFTLLATIILLLGVGVCVYSLFQYKIYWSWLAIVGIGITIFMLVLIVL